jgi:hypothetical protein
MHRLLSTAQRCLAALIVSWATVSACAQEVSAPSIIGPYVVLAGGSSKYTSEPGFVTCICRSDKSKAFKFGGGYRFGVSAIEGWFIDFGQATFQGDDFNRESTARIRALALGGAWTARFGQSVEATWRVGMAEVHLASEGQSSTRLFRPIVGASVGVHVAQPVTVELFVDYTLSRDAAGTVVDVGAAGLGVRLRF